MCYFYIFMIVYRLKFRLSYQQYFVKVVRGVNLLSMW